MKILYITHSHLMYGANKALFNLINGIRSHKNFECKVIIPNEGVFNKKLNDIGVSTEIAEVPICVYPKIKSLRDLIAFPIRLIRTIKSYFKSCHQIYKIAKDFNPDIIHSNVGVIHSGYTVARKMGIKHVWHIREFQDLFFDWTPIPLESIFKKKLNDKKVNFNIVISDVLKKHYRLSRNATVIYDGVFGDNDIKPINYNKSKYFLYVGSLHASKGIHEIIEAFKLISPYYPEFSLKIAGDGPEKVKIESEILGYKNIELLGFRTDIYNLMLNALCIVVASNFEGFGFITVEAMLNGSLVIGKNTAATKEQFDNILKATGREVGIRFEGKDELVDSMKRVICMSMPERNSLIEIAQKFVIETYSIQQHALLIYKKYCEILKTE